MAQESEGKCKIQDAKVRVPSRAQESEDGCGMKVGEMEVKVKKTKRRDKSSQAEVGCASTYTARLSAFSSAASTKHHPTSTIAGAYRGSVACVSDAMDATQTCWMDG